MSVDGDPKWDYVAESPKDLAELEEVALTGPTQKDLDTLRFLTATTAQRLLTFPVCVKHTAKTSTRPDFMLLAGNRRIALECAKIMTTNLGHAEAIQLRGATDLPLRRSSLLDPQKLRLSKREIIDQAFVMTQEVFPPTLAAVDQQWLELLDQTVRRKLDILDRPDFPHGDVDWLALWDRTGSQEWQMQRRIASIRTSLAPTWKRRHSFEHAFILAEDFSWFVALSSNSLRTAA